MDTEASPASGPDAGSGTGRLRTGILRRVFSKPETLIFSAYAAVTVFMTYPAVTLFSRTYAEPKDPLLYLWWSWWFRFSFQNGMPVSPINIVSVPFAYSWSPYSQEQLTNLSLRGLSIVGGGTFAYNVLLLVFFFITAVAAYYLGRYVTGSRAGGAVTGFAFGFSPYMLTHGKEHISMIAAFCLPLFLLTVLYAWRRKSPGSFVLCGVALLVTALFNSHYGLLASFLLAMFGITLWLTGRPWRSWKTSGFDRTSIMRGLPVAVVVAGALACLSLLARSSPIGGPKELSTLYAYSARIWDYFVPHAESLMMGNLTRGFITRNLHGGFLVESSLFLGFVPMVLAAYGVYGNLRRRKAAGDGGGEEPGSRDGSSGSPAFSALDKRRITWALLVALAASMIMSFPPTVELLGVKLYMPSYLAHKVLPQVRAYARFGLVAMLSVAVLAGFGVARLVSRFNRLRFRAILTAFVCVVVLLEFTIVPPFVSLETERPAEYAEWLKRQEGESVVAMYPMFYTNDFENYGYFFEQRFHGKPLVNGAQPGSDGEALRQVILDPYHPSTPGILRTMGTQYVLVIPSLYEEGRHLNYPFEVDIEGRDPPAGLREEARSGDFIAYSLESEPAFFFPFFQEGTFQAYVDSQGRSWHPSQSRAVVDLFSHSGSSVECDVAIPVRCTQGHCTVEVRRGNELLAESPLREGFVEDLSFRVELHPGRNPLVLTSTCEPALLADVPGYEAVKASLVIGEATLVKVVEPPR